jgi:hypothetical protein
VFAVSQFRCNTCGKFPFEAEVGSAKLGGPCTHGLYPNMCSGKWEKNLLPTITWPEVGGEG